MIKFNLAKIKATILKQKFKFLGLPLLMLVIMLLSGLFTYIHNSDRKAIQDNTTIDTRAGIDSTNVQDLNPIKSKTKTPNNSQPNADGGTRPSSSSSPNQPYVPYSCIKTPIPYETEYVNTLGLYIGETISLSGSDGYKSTCTLGSTSYKPDDYISQPINKKVYVGTAIKPTDGPTAGEIEAARQQRVANCIQYIKRLSGGSDAYLQCNYID